MHRAHWTDFAECSALIFLSSEMRMHTCRVCLDSEWFETGSNAWLSQTWRTVMYILPKLCWTHCSFEFYWDTQDHSQRLQYLLRKWRRAPSATHKASCGCALSSQIWFQIWRQSRSGLSYQLVVHVQGVEQIALALHQAGFYWQWDYPRPCYTVSCVKRNFDRSFCEESG